MQSLVNSEDLRRFFKDKKGREDKARPETAVRPEDEDANSDSCMPQKY